MLKPIAAGGLWASAATRLWRRRGARVAVCVIGVIVALACIGPFLSPWTLEGLDWRHLAQPPGAVASHWLGTDRLGRDLYVRTLHGVRLSLALSVVASALSLLIGRSPFEIGMDEKIGERFQDCNMKMEGELSRPS